MHTAYLIAIFILTTFAPAHAVTLESLNGKRINASSVSEVKTRKNDNTYVGDFFATYDLTITGNKVSGTIGGHFVYQGNRAATISQDVTGVIGTPRAGSENDQFLWSFQSNVMTLRRIFDKYGMIMRVSVSGTRCTIQSGIAKAVGGGPVMIASAFGGMTELLSVKLKTSKCTLT